MLSSPLCDAVTFVEGLEDAYREMWHCYVESQSEELEGLHQPSKSAGGPSAAATSTEAEISSALVSSPQLQRNNRQSQADSPTASAQRQQSSKYDSCSDGGEPPGTRDQDEQDMSPDDEEPCVGRAGLAVQDVGSGTHVLGLHVRQDSMNDSANVVQGGGA